MITNAFTALTTLCCGIERLNPSKVSPCDEASSRWWREPCVCRVNAVVVWIDIAALCVKLAQFRERERETEIVQLTTLSHSYRAHTNIHMTTNIHCYTKKIMFYHFLLQVKRIHKDSSTLIRYFLFLKCISVTVKHQETTSSSIWDSLTNTLSALSHHIWSMHVSIRVSVLTS